jgi:uncharacterized circularly permuted ATP-grasp superfamily protein/uncharacterized alpha-E superfamily protein
MIDSYLVDKMFNNMPFLDELATVEGKVSPQWSRLARFYDKEEVSRQLRENGVTYNVYGDPDGMNRPWKLDPVPMVISGDDWELIEKGLQQRAHLLNYILSDIYGSRHLIKDGLIPFELIYNHKGFLRQADKIKIDGDQQLIQYAADLARGPNGKMWVLHDRTDAPSGAGYAFENRAAMIRVFPDLIRENQVRKISSYFQILKNSLVHLTSRNQENPKIVLLSPGPTNETYFEHAYISSFMGFTLAFGEDLTVSDGYVWLKTLKGLEKVDVIIRRVDDVFCDPLEFRSDSHLGVVGLMEAVRQKKVLIINPLGCRILENPGLMAFLPKICRSVLGEELILPSVATWWCGQEKEKQYVLDKMDTLIIRKIYRDDNQRSVFGGDLSQDEKYKLRSEINRSPYLFAAQEVVNFSTTPVWINQKLEARNAVFRSYIVADAQNKDYVVMPGGLSTSSPQKGIFIVSNQAGGISKDTWVLGKTNEERSAKVANQRDAKVQAMVRPSLPSRTGEHLFWMGRYMERAVSVVRLMRMALMTYTESDEDIQTTDDPVLFTQLKSLTKLTGTAPGFTKKSILKNPDKELFSLALEDKRMGSLAHSLNSFLSNGFAVRDRLSLDTWRILDSVSEELTTMRNHRGNLMWVYHSLDNLIVKLMAFYGLNIDNMTREPTWHLLNVGRFIESGINSCMVLDSMLSKNFSPEVNKSLMEDTLRCNESLVTYRYRYRSILDLNAVLSLLMVDEDNPRSLIYQILRIERHLKGLPEQAGQEGYSVARKKLMEAITKLRLVDINSITELDESRKTFADLRIFLSEISTLLSETAVQVMEKYFSHTGNRYSMIQSSILPEI